MLAGTALNASITNLSYFTGGGNTLPLQLFLGLASLFLLFRIRSISIGIVCFSLAVLLIIALYNFSNPTSLITNPCIPLLFLMSAFAGARLHARNQEAIDRTAVVFLTLQLVFHVFYNSSFSAADTLTGRSKGFGSGTTYSLMAAIMLIYLSLMLTQGRLHRFTFCTLAIVPIWTIFLTQSRGAFLSLVIILIVKNLLGVRSFFKLFAAATLMACIIAISPDILTKVPLFDRLQISSNSDLEAFSSGRIQTQRVIMGWISSEPSFLSLLLGAEGLNGVKRLTSQGLEFPHLDLLYLLYDTGLLGVGLYIVMMLLLLIRTRFDSYMLLFFLSALHTNMVLSPTFLILSIVLHHVSKKKLKNTGAKIEHSHKSPVDHSWSLVT
ncbi:hypothetical protein [Donghicola eburneus]|uniref:hypothetical protein n=1 Tax=Donghicola eburneus TaxID=393278 RepID=UPI0008E4CD55|nr:hypothetical protein [Donghicola eburneus]SFQ78703.1 hypothetical protein SAMN05421764_1245 [Donghicola eburneus]